MPSEESGPTAIVTLLSDRKRVKEVSGLLLNGDSVSEARLDEVSRVRVYRGDRVSVMKVMKRVRKDSVLAPATPHGSA